PARRRGVRARAPLGRPTPPDRLGVGTDSWFERRVRRRTRSWGRPRRGPPRPPPIGLGAPYGAAGVHRVAGAAGAVREPEASPREREGRRHHPRPPGGEAPLSGGAARGGAPAVRAPLEGARERRDPRPRLDRRPPAVANLGR